MLRRCATTVVLLVALVAAVSHFQKKKQIQPQQESIRQQQQQQQQRRGGGRRLTKWLDPKTVVSKDSFHERDIDLKSLRYVAFGTSKTWGADLDDRENEAYIKLLSPHAVNNGLRATPADYPSLCLHSMIGDSVFDVIILEFSPYNGPHLDDFTRLIKRLRERFPDAVIIFLPIFMLFHDVMYKSRGLFDYILTQNIKTPHDPEFETLVQNLDEADLQYPSSAYALKEYYDVVNSMNGHVLEFPVFSGDIKQFIRENIPYFGSKVKPWDYIHPNALGHMLIAATIRDKLTEIYSQPRPVLQGLGTWVGGEDQCVTWFSNGHVPADEIRDVRNMKVVNFMKTDGKWALEVNPHHHGGVGYFNLICPFDHCNIYLSYMAKGPERAYPRVTVAINDKNPTLIDPLLHNFHLRQIAYVGTADYMGVTTVTIKPVEGDEAAPNGFRITGVIRTPTVHVTR